MSQQWFGEPWPDADHPAPVCDDPTMQVKTPVGALCLFCATMIGPDDQGTMMPYVDAPGLAKIRPAHKECMMRQVLGGPAHLLGECTCCGGTEDPDRGMSPREAALWVWDYWISRG